MSIDPHTGEMTFVRNVPGAYFLLCACDSNDASPTETSTEFHFAILDVIQRQHLVTLDLTANKVYTLPISMDTYGSIRTIAYDAISHLLFVSTDNDGVVLVASPRNGFAYVLRDKADGSGLVTLGAASLTPSLVASANNYVALAQTDNGLVFVSVLPNTTAPSIFSVVNPSQSSVLYTLRAH